MYDPIPDLAGLVDGITSLFDQARGGATNADLTLRLGMLAADIHYARLRGGLLLDEPGREAVTTEAAIREALRDYLTKGGRLLSEADIAALAAEAERGYDPATIAWRGPSPYRQPEAGMFAWIPPASESVAPPRDLPVISAVTAVMSYRKLVNYYQRIWPEDRFRATRRRLLTLAGNLPEHEREQMPAWLLQLVHSDLREGT